MYGEDLIVKQVVSNLTLNQPPVLAPRLPHPLPHPHGRDDDCGDRKEPGDFVLIVRIGLPGNSISFSVNQSLLKTT